MTAAETLTGNERYVDELTRVDAVVVGAGFSGLRMLLALRELGLSAVILEAGTDVGGTWYWNRYPGARTDSEAWYYCYSFSKELQAEWDWPERFPTQDQVLGYLRHVADRFDLRREIVFGARVESAVYNEARARWGVKTEDGRRFQARYFISATGPLSQPYLPDFPGIKDFKGEVYATAMWPDEHISFEGKRVAVIGTGASAVQSVPIIAQTAAELTVFQRTPNYVLPARNHTLTTHHREAIKANYDEIWSAAERHFFGFAMELAGRTMDEVPPDDVERILEAGWETGGFRFVFETFDDIFTNIETNNVVSEFIRRKIRTIVNDPSTAELLCPKNHPLGSKRPPLGHFYYETYNRPNVKLVNVSAEPITRITGSGIEVEERHLGIGHREYEFDMIVFATGFDAVSGALMAMDIRGRDGRSLQDYWSDGPHTYLGLAVHGFPNFFVLCGPQVTTANIPVVVEHVVDYTAAAVRYAEERGPAVMEPRADVIGGWEDELVTSLNQTIIPHGKLANSWYFGSNMPGKAIAPLFWFGGAGSYFDLCEAEIGRGFTGFTVTDAPAAPDAAGMTRVEVGHD